MRDSNIPIATDRCAPGIHVARRLVSVRVSVRIDHEGLAAELSLRAEHALAERDCIVTRVSSTVFTVRAEAEDLDDFHDHLI